MSVVIYIDILKFAIPKNFSSKTNIHVVTDLMKLLMQNIAGS